MKNDKGNGKRQRGAHRPAEIGIQRHSLEKTGAGGLRFARCFNLEKGKSYPQITQMNTDLKDEGAGVIVFYLLIPDFLISRFSFLCA